MWVSTAEAKALGLALAQPATDLDGYVGFSSALPFTYDPNNRAVAGKYDFIGVAEHEFTELMGRIDLFNATLSDGTTTIPNTYSLLDMYHYTASGVHTYTGTTTNYFSADGGHTNLDYFNTISGGDPGDWAASAGADSYLAFSPTDQADVVSQADITTMNALGYENLPLSPITIESAGSTALMQTGNDFFLNSVGGGTGPEVTLNGAPLGADQVAGWTAIGAEVLGGGGYEMAWHQNGGSLYTVWNLDSAGNYVSTIGIVAGNSATLENLEPSFHQDLNGEGTVGVVNVAGGSTEGSAGGKGGAVLTLNTSSAVVNNIAIESGATLIGVPDQQHDHG
jgi:serralysin